MGEIELLRRALPILRLDVMSLIECCSILRHTETGEIEPIAGTCNPDAAEDVTERLLLIRDIEAATGKTFIGPQWFDDMIFYGLQGRPV